MTTRSTLTDKFRVTGKERMKGAGSEPGWGGGGGGAEGWSDSRLRLSFLFKSFGVLALSCCHFASRSY